MAVFNLNAIAVELYSTPITWKGDPVGHIGKKDAFFYVVKGECYVRIENESFIIKEGELAFLPEGKMRTYSTINSEFSALPGFSQSCNRTQSPQTFIVQV